jgi:6-phosphofructokinase 1
VNPKSIKRIGVFTGGGDCPGLNAVIRAVTKSAIFQYGLEVWGIEDGFMGLIRNRMHRMNAGHVSNILTLGGTILGTNNQANPAHFAVGHDEQGKPIFEDVTHRVLEHVKARRLDALVCIGGDGTMAGTAHLAGKGIPVVGVPKTIDNDLMHTDVTFGWQTAVNTATEALDRIHTTASSHHRVMIVELMGRNAGWLTLHAGLASGADVILIPEIPYNLDVVRDVCVRRSQYGKKFTIIACSEGARPEGGTQVVRNVIAESPDPIRLGGVSSVLRRQLEEGTDLTCRETILGHVQRGGTPVPADRTLATLFGYKALELLLKGEYNRMVALQDNHVTSVPVEDVAGKQRTIPADDPFIAAARAVGTCFGDKKMEL